MCIIIHKPAGARLAFSSVLRAYQRNDDGWGLVARTPSGLIVRRDYGNDADATLLDAYAEMQDYEVTLHCRIGTSGERSVINTHPFNVVGNMWLFHNGVIDIDRSIDARFCDTHHVARALQNVFEEPAVDASRAIRDADYTKRLEEFAKSSKLVFVDEYGVVIVNERFGFWTDGCWFSNESSERDYRPFTLTGTSGSSLATACSDEPFSEYDARDDAAQSAYYDDIIPRSYRVDTAEDEDQLYLDALGFIADCQQLEVDDIAERCVEYPELAAEAVSVLLQERHLAATTPR